MTILELAEAMRDAGVGRVSIRIDARDGGSHLVYMVAKTEERPDATCIGQVADLDTARISRGDVLGNLLLEMLVQLREATQ